MRFLADTTIGRGRVIITKDSNIIAMAMVQTLAIVSYAPAVGDEARASGNDVEGPRLGAWRCQAEGSAMRLHSNDQIAPGHVVVRQQGGEVLICRLADLRCEPRYDAETVMVVNPVDVAAASAMSFEDKRVVL